MIEMIKRLLKFSGSKRNDLLASFVFSLLDSVFEMLPIMAILTVLSTLLTAAEGGAMMTATIWISLGIMVVSIAGRIFFNNLSCVKRTLGSFAMCAQKRLEIGEHMKRVPMGYFSENRLGEIAAAATTTLGDIENNAVIVLERVADGFIHAIVIGVWLLFYEWHIGLLMFAGLAVSMLVYAGIQRAAKRLSPRRQAAQANLVTCFLEYIQGMGVVKAFGLGERSGKAVNQAIRESAEANIALESTFSSLTGVYQTIFRVSRAAILVIASYLLLGGEITPVKCLLLLVSSFMIYSSVELVGSMASVARVIDASLDRMEAVMDTPVLDEHGSDITPKRFDIELQNVSFAYGQEDVLHDITMTIPEKTTCAVVGPSGSGKSTILNLIAKYYEPSGGAISIGGRPTGRVAAERVLEQISMVDQDVFLFDDTIRDNIRHARPEATDGEIEAACREANCDGFIRSMEKGYDTPTGENGNLLSGGERQRISIARAILKNSPILLLDEATASLDIENELAVKQAIANLLKEKKTVVMIAHTLSIVKNADQILVVADGKIAEAGTHEELLAKNGKYAAMWQAEQKISA